tara:strand:+ start:266 stop:547 length:282 start_codon:yes stop_codon:yes gene_type:complete
MYKNVTNPDQTFETVIDFFKDENAGVDDKSALDAHIANDNKYQDSKETTLLSDKKTVLMTRDFEDEETAEKWLEERAKLPTIDKNLKEERMTF